MRVGREGERMEEREGQSIWKTKKEEGRTRKWGPRCGHFGLESGLWQFGFLYSSFPSPSFFFSPSSSFPSVSPAALAAPATPAVPAVRPGRPSGTASSTRSKGKGEATTLRTRERKMPKEQKKKEANEGGEGQVYINTYLCMGDGGEEEAEWKHGGRGVGNSRRTRNLQGPVSFPLLFGAEPTGVSSELTHQPAGLIVDAQWKITFLCQGKAPLTLTFLKFVFDPCRTSSSKGSFRLLCVDKLHHLSVFRLFYGDRAFCKTQVLTAAWISDLWCRWNRKVLGLDVASVADLSVVHCDCLAIELANLVILRPASCNNRPYMDERVSAVPVRPSCTTKPTPKTALCKPKSMTFFMLLHA